MLKSLRLAAIDVGSNAIRMVICDYTPKGFVFLEKFRFPIRLGSDVFETGQISGKILKESARSFKKFAELSRKHRVQRIRAVGTSALREARNQKAFVELMERKSGIVVEVISGSLEAELIALAISKEVHLENHLTLLLDVGGGSVEFTLVNRGQTLATKSEPMGTVRVLEKLKKRGLGERQLGLVMEDFLPVISDFLKKRPSEALDFAVGTGGNIEAFGKLKSWIFKTPTRSFVSLSEIETMIEKIQALSLRDRVEKLKLRPDRADVILPALHLVSQTLKLAQVEQMFIPYVGLKEGLLWTLVQEAASPNF